ncbi:low molecular weight protein-tyrosine-phosphatase [Acinetobacter shaoyimingii]|uniref:protein-tyrosine-phosphatase n=1 Tax=Acinetobacter shaoyimingii TaxID=2715164 RepID=A0A6G8RRI0_9GAMM|nr:low molecular weight protein-tyrosine-phosphatase [Acinetobacter shaoyimingii]NHB56945.1 low molecular weight phosphotyrosine protein phosphatase [Acinetobacter shaoyimingii]QIO04542.1 low molecular weight phosphotyrosine protein phosphatase [Acinetobacter shaoyimingii]
MKIGNILVVCVGNICRSPMAEYFLRQKYPHLHIESAGISALVGHPADQKAITAMSRYNIELKNHVAKQLTADLIRQADLVLVMSQNQLKHIEQKWSFSTGKTFRLGHWQNKNVADPFQHEQLVFDEACTLIQSCIADWQPYI